MKILGVIPSRYASKRFPGKALVDIGGKTMIQRVYEQASKCNSYSDLVVATDDDRIYDHIKLLGGNVMMTLSDHMNGTERCNEVLETIAPEYDYVVNIQGDEPFVHPETLENLNSILDGNVEIGTLLKKVEDHSILDNPNEIKVAINKRNEALYFSRSKIPYSRNDSEMSISQYYKHIGIYAYRSDILKKISQLEASPLELSESLEQLRWLENGYKINVTFTDHQSIGIDSPEDLKEATKYL